MQKKSVGFFKLTLLFYSKNTLQYNKGSDGGEELMQVEHINENTIRVRINKAELEKRGLKVLDLLGDKDKIQQFFYSILDEIDTDHSFSQDAPVTFQVMPNNGGLDLLITKTTEKDRDKLSKLFENDFGDLKKSKFGDSRRSFLDLEDDGTNDVGTTDSNKPKVKKAFWKLQKKQAYSFNDFNDVTELAGSLLASDLSSSLYFERGLFYLDLAFIDENYVEIKPEDAWIIANEYGTKVKTADMARIRTTSKCLIERDALEQLRHYFGHLKH